MNGVFKCVLGLILISSSFCAIAQEKKGPLGIYMGMSKEELKKQIPQEAEINVIKESVVSSHAPVSVDIIDDMYIFIAPDETGLCQAAGITKETSSEQSVVSVYNTIKKALAEKYGEPRSFEGGANGSSGLISELSLEKTIYGSLWDKDLPDNLSSIELQVLPGKKFITAKVRVLYYFKNNKECRAIIDKQRTSGL